MFLVPLVAALFVAGMLFDVPQGPARSALLILVYASATLLSALLLVPIESNMSSRSFRILVGQCALAITVFVLTTQLDPQARIQIGKLLPLAVILFLLLLSALSIVMVNSRHQDSTRQLVFLVIAISLSAPLWLGPLAEATGNSSTTTNLIVGVSPLSALAVSLDLDYLRTSWFYQHSVLGSLRYEYYSWSNYVLLLALITAGFAFHATGVKFHRILNRIKNRVSTS